MKTTYKIDPAHSGAHFTVRHMMITNVRGGFKTVNGTVVYDPENPAASSIQAEIDAASISTNDDQRDAHLRSARLPGRREVSDDHVPQHQRRAGGRRRVEGDGRPHDPRRDPAGRA